LRPTHGKQRVRAAESISNRSHDPVAGEVHLLTSFLTASAAPKRCGGQGGLLLAQFRQYGPVALSVRHIQRGHLRNETSDQVEGSDGGVKSGENRWVRRQ
jgi:hypothetical protein